MAVPCKALLVALWGFCWPGLAAAPPAPSPTVAELAPEVPRLRSLCAPLWSDLSPECLAELDRVYMDRDVGRNWHSGPAEYPGKSGVRNVWSAAPARDRIVWRDVFEDPLALRSAVNEAAAEPRCRARVGETPHHLREDCAADAFARLSVLRHACDDILFSDGRERHDWAGTWARIRRSLDETARDAYDHALRATTLDESELHIAWRLPRCRAVPPAALDRVVALRISPFDFHLQSQWRELRIVAARLGSPWANTRVGRSGRAGADVNATAEADLVLAYVRRGAIAASNEYWRLPYLLAAREYDLRAHAPQIDWSELERYFSQTAIDRARPAVERLLRGGWQPMEERDYWGENVTWPWAVAPAVVETQIIARRIDPGGTVRWVYESGAEHWLDSEGRGTYWDPESGETTRVAHTELGYYRRLPKLRSWMDEHGRPRWLDHYGVEHWIDADGAEHWIDFGGTEWILLPPDPPPDDGPRQ